MWGVPWPSSGVAPCHVTGRQGAEAMWALFFRQSPLTAQAEQTPGGEPGCLADGEFLRAPEGQQDSAPGAFPSLHSQKLLKIPLKSWAMLWEEERRA